MITCFTRALNQEDGRLLLVKHELLVRSRFEPVWTGLGWCIVLSIVPALFAAPGLARYPYHPLDQGTLICLGIIVIVVLFHAIIYWSRHQARRWRSILIKKALQRGSVSVLHCQASAVVEFEDTWEKNPCCYFFQVEPTKLLWLAGETYRETEQFPNTDFFIEEVEVDKQLVITSIRCNGNKLVPLRLIGTQDQKALFETPLPLHDRDTIDGSLTDLTTVFHTARA